MNVIPKFSRKWRIAVTTLIALFVLSVPAVIVPSRMSDGTERYSGIKQEVARRALKDISNYCATPLPPYRPILVVEDVRPAKPNEQGNRCTRPGEISPDPNDPWHYTVVVSVRTFFGIRETTFVIQGH